MKLLKYGFLCGVLILISIFGYFRFIKSPRPYDSWRVAHKHACVYGAYSFSYLFKLSLDDSKINAECVRILNSNAAVQAKSNGLLGYFCGQGITLVFDEKNPEQNHFMQAGKDHLFSENRAKATELIRICLEAVRTKFESLENNLNVRPGEIGAPVEPPPQDLFRQFANFRCDVASAPPCFE